MQNFVRQALDFAIKFNEVFLEKFDIERLLPMLDPEITWINNRCDKIHQGFDEVSLCLKEENEIFMGNYKMVDPWYKLTLVCDNTAIVYGETKIKPVAGDSLINWQYRYSLGIKLLGNEMFLYHIHISVPYEEQDAATGIYNKINTEIKVSNYFNDAGDLAKGALLILDIDNFKEINDNYGHLFGDKVLRDIAKRMSELFPRPSILGRIGGDEFLIFVTEFKSRNWLLEEVRIFIFNFRNAFSDYRLKLNPSCSVGVAFAPKDGKIYRELFWKADTALYQAKNKGKNCCCVWEPEMQKIGY